MTSRDDRGGPCLLAKFPGDECRTFAEPPSEWCDNCRQRANGGLDFLQLVADTSNDPHLVREALARLATPQPGEPISNAATIPIKEIGTTPPTTDNEPAERLRRLIRTRVETGPDMIDLLDRALAAERASGGLDPIPSDDTIQLLRTGEAELLSDAELRAFRDYADARLATRQSGEDR